MTDEHTPPPRIKAWPQKQWQKDDDDLWIVADGLWYLPEEPAGPHAREYVRADIADELLEALEKIEAGLPAGSSLLDCRDPLWRDAYRELQRTARAAIAKARGQRDG